MDSDSYFKDFTLAEYRFIVVNKTTLVPLVWIFPETATVGTIVAGSNSSIKFRDPQEIGEELNNYLVNKPLVPMNINLVGDNNIIDWINTNYE